MYSFQIIFLIRQDYQDILPFQKKGKNNTYYIVHQRSTKEKEVQAEK